jgi:hypothetical protein
MRRDSPDLHMARAAILFLKGLSLDSVTPLDKLFSRLKRFLLFKGPGYFTKKFKLAEYLKAHRFTPSLLAIRQYL